MLPDILGLKSRYCTMVLYTVPHSKVHKSTATCRGCMHMTMYATRELTYVTGHANSRLHLWKFTAWRLVCRGLTVDMSGVRDPHKDLQGGHNRIQIIFMDQYLFVCCQTCLRWFLSRGCRDGRWGQFERRTWWLQGAEKRIQFNSIARIVVTEIQVFLKGTLPLPPWSNTVVVNEVLSWRLPNRHPVIRR